MKKVDVLSQETTTVTRTARYGRTKEEVVSTLRKVAEQNG